MRTRSILTLNPVSAARIMMSRPGGNSNRRCSPDAWLRPQPMSNIVSLIRLSFIHPGSLIVVKDAAHGGTFSRRESLGSYDDAS
jgi:hypothetical protein